MTRNDRLFVFGTGLWILGGVNQYQNLTWAFFSLIGIGIMIYAHSKVED